MSTISGSVTVRGRVRAASLHTDGRVTYSDGRPVVVASRDTAATFSPHVPVTRHAGWTRIPADITGAGFLILAGQAPVRVDDDADAAYVVAYVSVWDGATDYEAAQSVIALVGLDASDAGLSAVFDYADGVHHGPTTLLTVARVAAAHGAHDPDGTTTAALPSQGPR